MSESRSKIESPNVVCGAWLLVGFVGAAEAAREFTQLFNDKPLQLTAIALIFSGIALAIASWRCGWIALERIRQASIHDTNAPADPTSPALKPLPERARGVQRGSYSAAIGPQTP